MGGSLGFTIPKALADSAGLHEGDLLYVTRSENGLAVSAYDPDFQDALDDAMEFMHSHRNAFRELAK